MAEALRLACALELDPRYGRAATIAGGCHFLNVAQAWAADPTSEIAEALRLLQLALSIDWNDLPALSLLGRVTAFWSGDFDTAREMVDRAVASNPHGFILWENRGWTYQLAGQPEEAIRSFERAIRLHRFDPWLVSTFTGLAIKSFQHFKEELGPPSETTKGFRIWDTKNGSVILQNGSSGNGFQLAVYLTSAAIKNFDLL